MNLPGWLTDAIQAFLLLLILVVAGVGVWGFTGFVMEILK